MEGFKDGVTVLSILDTVRKAAINRNCGRVIMPCGCCLWESAEGYSCIVVWAGNGQKNIP